MIRKPASKGAGFIVRNIKLKYYIPSQKRVYRY